jgi:hypothetical protein
MRIKVIKATIGLTINTGDFNSGRIDIGAEADVGGEEGLILEEAATQHGKLTEYLRRLVVDEVARVKQMSREARKP